MNTLNSTPIAPTTTTPANTTDSDTFVIEPLAYQPTLGEKPGRFIDMQWDTTPRKNNAQRRDLVLIVELNENGEHFKVPFHFNFLPRGRGKTEFKDQMESFFGNPLTPNQLAGLKKDVIVHKSVIVRYTPHPRGGVEFDKFLPVPPAQPVAVQPVAVQPVAVQPVAAQPVAAQPVTA